VQVHFSWTSPSTSIWEVYSWQNSTHYYASHQSTRDAYCTSGYQL